VGVVERGKWRIRTHGELRGLYTNFNIGGGGGEAGMDRASWKGSSENI